MQNVNFVVATDSYKLGHWSQYPHDTEGVYSYEESRLGAEFAHTVFFGLQYLLKEYFVGQAVTWDDISEARELCAALHGRPGVFNYPGWAHIMEKHGGRLPLRIKAVPEGTVLPINNVKLTVENTDPECFWLTNAVETMLTLGTWYPSNVATISRYTIQEVIRPFLEESAMDLSALPYMLHDFGMRGSTSYEAAQIGGCAHLINSLGSDTVPAMRCARDYYGAPLKGLAASVIATEHSTMSARGRDGEPQVVQQLLDNNPLGIMSVVGDTYNIYDFTRMIGQEPFRSRILGRNGVFVERPDSVTEEHPTPEQLVVWIIKQLWHDFGGTNNAKGYLVLDPHIRLIWGDGIDPEGIYFILKSLLFHGFSAENIVFGMGGGLLQKHNRDTQREAFKASSIRRVGEWHDIYKEPLDASKLSKRGRLSLLRPDIAGNWVTVPEVPDCPSDWLHTVFEDGKLVKEYTFDEIRANADSAVLAMA